MTAASKAEIKSDNSQGNAAEVVMKQQENLMMFCWDFYGVTYNLTARKRQIK